MLTQAIEEKNPVKRKVLEKRLGLTRAFLAQFYHPGLGKDALWREWNALREKVVVENQGLIKIIARKREWGNPEIWAAGRLGLLMAADRFDVHAHMTFPTYAPHWIKNFIVRFRKLQEEMIHIPEDHLTKEKKSNGTNQIDIQTTINTNVKTTDTQTRTGEERSLYDTVRGDRNPTMDRVFHTDDFKVWRKNLDYYLKFLHPSVAKVIQLSFPPTGAIETLGAVAKQFTVQGVTKERIRQLRKQGLIQLRVLEALQRISNLTPRERELIEFAAGLIENPTILTPAERSRAFHTTYDQITETLNGIETAIADPEIGDLFLLMADRDFDNRLDP